MMSSLIDKLVGGLDDKRRWRQYRTRVTALPATHRETVRALERYLLHFGMITVGEVPISTTMSMLEALTELFEQAAGRGDSVDKVIGSDPVPFAEDFFRRYSDGSWTDKAADPSLGAIEKSFYEELDRDINRERTRLTKTVQAAEQDGACS